MKNNIKTFLFVTVVLVGYAFQISRFHNAHHQYNNFHTYEKGLTKRVLARVGPQQVNTRKFTIRRAFNLLSKTGEYDLISELHDAYFAKYLKHSALNFRLYHSPYLNASGERGPPEFAIFS